MDKQTEYKIRAFIKDISKYVSPNIILIELKCRHFPDIYRNNNMRTKKEIELQLDLAIKEQTRIVKNVPIGSGAYSRQQRYIDALRWVLYGE